MAKIWHKTGLDRQAIIDKAHENTLVETLDIKITEIGDDYRIHKYFIRMIDES